MRGLALGLLGRATTNPPRVRPGRSTVPTAADARPRHSVAAATCASSRWSAARGRTSGHPRAPELQHITAAVLGHAACGQRCRWRGLILERASAVHFSQKLPTATGATDARAAVSSPRSLSTRAACSHRQIKCWHANAHRARACAAVPRASLPRHTHHSLAGPSCSTSQLQLSPRVADVEA